MAIKGAGGAIRKSVNLAAVKAGDMGGTVVATGMPDRKRHMRVDDASGKNIGRNDPTIVYGRGPAKV